jgi:hypothetical protein
MDIIRIYTRGRICGIHKFLKLGCNFFDELADLAVKIRIKLKMIFKELQKWAN